ncbi:hypothetical protein O181_024575 [Austropuccinia psidii MF-1]|uniref:BRCA2 OB1 domain-containing protein n=1 Tax=Austropuccinia psidii MF-1 TaxID=1389203 RepID=A0A9Q3CL57_9BASI|nr:hypothetical protein [Austropuccinia psidii MF-1]
MAASPGKDPAVRPCRTVSSIFQTGAGLPYPINDDGKDTDTSAIFKQDLSPKIYTDRMDHKASISLGSQDDCPVFGFQTAKGRPVAAPTKESLKKALDLCSTNLIPVGRHSPIPDSPSPLHRAKIHKTTQLIAHQGVSDDDKTIAENNNVPSSEAQSRVDGSSDDSSHRISNVTSNTSSLNQSQPSPPRPTATSGLFTTGAGQPIRISHESIEQARAFLQSGPVSPLESCSPSITNANLPLKDVSNYQTTSSNDKSMEPVDFSNIQPLAELRNTTLPSTTAPPIPAIPFESNKTDFSISTPIRPIGYFEQSPSTALRKASHEILTSARTRYTTPARRISNKMPIGLTPQSVSLHHDLKNAGSRPFVTPFKRDADVILQNSKSNQQHCLRTPHADQVRAQDTPIYDSSKRSVMYVNPRSLEKSRTCSIPKTLIDWPKSPVDRVPMVTWLTSPKGYSARQLLSLGIPESVVFMTAKTAVVWNFNALTEPFGAIQALGELLESGSTITRTSPKWVANHWGLIVWKLAGIVRWQPDCLSRVWKPSNVIQQLKYRYQREFVMGHQSIIKRIIEHECPTSLPMCLVIVGIHRRPLPKRLSGLNNPNTPSLGDKYVLELSDGWYKIKATVDPVIERVIKRGGLKVGYKLALSGIVSELSAVVKAKAPQTASKSSAIAEAQENSDEPRLYLEGNSTARAKWHESLGFRYPPWFATLRSLTHDGGRIPMMDIVIIDIAPLMFISDDGKMGRWGEVEERMLQAAWEAERAREAERVTVEREQEFEVIVKLSELINELYTDRLGKVSHASGFEASQLADFDAEGMVEELVEESKGIQDLRELSIDYLGLLQKTIVRKVETFQKGLSEALQKSLDERIPIRRTRRIQALKIKDFQTYRHSSQNRTAELMVQDMSKLSDGFLKKGSRYWVQNLQPQRRITWNARLDKVELSLSTKRDTRWRHVPLGL